MEGVTMSQVLAQAAESMTQVSKALLVMNPGARGGRRALAAVVDAFQRAGVSCEVAETRAPGHATELIREFLVPDVAVVDAVFTLGGDGTAMEVATALAEFTDAPPLGILAVGTANVLARSLGIPLRLEAAVRALLDAEVEQIDLGSISGGPRFAIGLGVGLDAAMIGGTSRMMKRRVGYLAYGWSALRAGLRLERFRARVTVDGAVYDVETSSVLVANFGSVLGDLISFGERIHHQDGLLDVCLFSPRSVFDAARIVWRMLCGGVSDDRCVHTISGRHIHIETDPPRPVQADGELLGLTPVEIRVEPKAIRLLAPRVPARRWCLRMATARVRTDPTESYR
jgi:YegS/Rv2252/BmrU family lipid kinase